VSDYKGAALMLDALPAPKRCSVTEATIPTGSAQRRWARLSSPGALPRRPSDLIPPSFLHARARSVQPVPGEATAPAARLASQPSYVDHHGASSRSAGSAPRPIHAPEEQNEARSSIFCLSIRLSIGSALHCPTHCAASRITSFFVDPSVTT